MRERGERVEDKKGRGGNGREVEEEEEETGGQGYEERMEVSQYAIMEHEKEKIRDEPGERD